MFFWVKLKNYNYFFQHSHKVDFFFIYLKNKKRDRNLRLISFSIASKIYIFISFCISKHNLTTTNYFIKLKIRTLGFCTFSRKYVRKEFTLAMCFIYFLFFILNINTKIVFTYQFS